MRMSRFQGTIIQSPATKSNKDAALNSQLYSQLLSTASVSSCAEVHAFDARPAGENQRPFYSQLSRKNAGQRSR